MNRRGAAKIAGAGLLIVAAGALAFMFRGARHAPAPPPGAPPTPLAGSARCRDCHADFYRRWSQSHHGLAMQPFATMVGREQLAAQQQDVVVAGRRFRADLAAGRVRETGPGGEIEHPIAHVMGGKDVYFFLTPYERGRLQVLPVAYDVRRKEWYDLAASALRHFTDVTEKAVHWTDPELTFNASCHGCHVSQLSSNYDLSTDSYRTTWAEPGINCETCHGSGEEHVRAVEQGAPG